MLCFFGFSDTWTWAPDNTITNVKHDVIVAADGSLWDRQSSDPNVLTSLTTPSAASVTLPREHRRGKLWRASSGSVLSIQDHDLQVWRDGGWLTLQSPTNEIGLRGAAEHQGVWWIRAVDRLYREENGAFVEVPVAGEPVGFVQYGNDMKILLSNESGGKNPLMLSPVVNNAPQKATKVGELSTTSVGTQVVTNSNGSWAVLGSYGTLHASIAGGKLTTVSDEALALLAIDGENRVWYVNEAGFVAWSADGTERSFPRAGHAMFQLRKNARCGLLGRGFAQLPGAPAAQQGHLALEVSGGAGLAFAMCDKRFGSRTCEDSPTKIAGTLDALGQWSGQVPIGEYSATVQINGTWMVADVLSVSARTAAIQCGVTVERPCTISLQVPN